MPRVKKPKPPRGYIIWRGPSPVDGRMLVCLCVKSGNRKTGISWQTWILVDDIYPSEALRGGEDYSICGNCIHRWRDVLVDGKVKRIRTCYVIAPVIASVWKAYKKGNYADLTHILVPSSRMYYCPEFIAALKTAKLLRLGAYGDPALVPFWVTEWLLRQWNDDRDNSQGHVGYTHQWKEPWWDSRYQQLLMLSCDTEEDIAEVHRRGGRAFYAGKEIPSGLSMCPASTEYKAKTGKSVTCGDCLLCNGERKARSIGIISHGTSKRFVGLPTRT